MKFNRLSSLFYFFAITVIFVARAQAKDDGKKVFENLKSLLVRVKAADSLASPKNSYGTGFVVDRNGLLATNYHVISDSVMQSGNQWKIVVELDDNKNIEGKLIDFSVIDDVALIKVDKQFSGALSFEKGALAKGDRAYSLGLPNDINMSVSPGTYNGILEYGPYQIIHVTTPINGGMSGGPTVNEDGKLVGINVARILFANDISFIVPEQRLHNLLAKVDLKNLKALSKDQAQTKLYDQLEQAQNLLVESLTSAKTQSVELWKNHSISVPNYLKCWSAGTDEPDSPYVLKHRLCRLDHALFITQGLDTGTFSLDATILESSRINAFAVEDLWGAPSSNILQYLEGGDTKSFGDIDAREIFSSYECKRGFMRAPFWGAEKTLRAALCIRRYKKAKDLYDFTYQLEDFQTALKVKVDISHSAVSLANIKKLMAYWLERFK